VRRTVGFVSFPVDWEGPIELPFSLFDKTPARTVRYKSQLQRRAFDLYLPKPILGDRADNPPTRLVTRIGRSTQVFGNVGFHACTILSGGADCDALTYELYRENVNSVRYVVSYNEGSYDLYIPKEVFGGQPWPNKVYLQVGIPEGE
jgi:hypothetical protein